MTTANTLIFMIIMGVGITFAFLVCWWIFDLVMEALDKRRNRFASHFRYDPETDLPLPKVDRVEDAGRLQ